MARLIWAACLPKNWSLPLVSFSLPFFGCFFYIKCGTILSFVVQIDEKVRI
jgi:hypothetical protein